MEAMQPFSPDKEKLGEFCKFFLHFGVKCAKIYTSGQPDRLLLASRSLVTREILASFPFGVKAAPVHNTSNP